MRNSPIKKTKPDHEIRLRGSFRTVNTGRLPRTWEVWEECPRKREQPVQRPWSALNLNLSYPKNRKRGPGWLEHSESDRKRQERREEVSRGQSFWAVRAVGASGFTPGAT